MAETTSQDAKAGRQKNGGRKSSSNRMSKTIVVKVTRTKSHGFYGRVVSHDKKFYAHDEKNTARVGDVVRLEETRPMSKLKRWRLKDIVRKATLVPEVLVDVDVNKAAS